MLEITESAFYESQSCMYLKRLYNKEKKQSFTTVDDLLTLAKLVGLSRQRAKNVWCIF